MDVDPRAFNAPLSVEHARRLVQLLDPRAGAVALDVGCGRGEALALWLEAGGGRALGVDPDADATARARRRLARHGDRADVQTAPVADAALPAQVDAALCVGAAHAFGGKGEDLGAALRALRERVRPGGRLLVGHGFWTRTPDPEYLAATGLERDELDTHAQNLVLGESLGLRPLWVDTASAEEWDQFEAGSALAVERRLDARPDEPELRALAERRRAWRRAYLRWGRETMGFGFYVYERPLQG